MHASNIAATPSSTGRRTRPTIRHVAAEAGVSIATVSGVLTKRVDCRASETTRLKVMAVAKRLGYRPSLMAHALHGKKTMTFGLVTGLSAEGEIWGRALTTFEETARAQGYMVLSSYTQNSPVLEDQVIDEMLYRQVDALAVYPTATGEHIRLKQLIDEGFPVITFDASGAMDLQADDVSIDQYHGGMLQAQHLVSNGYKRICLANIEPPEHVNRLKTQGLIAGLAEANLKIAGRMDLTHSWSTWSETQPSIYQEIKAYLKAHQGEFDAIAAHGDILALHTNRAAASLGIRVPQDLAVIGFNDILVAGLMSPELTTIKDPGDMLGKRGAEVLIDRLDEGEGPQRVNAGRKPLRIKIRPELIVRKSTRILEASKTPSKD